MLVGSVPAFICEGINRLSTDQPATARPNAVCERTDGCGVGFGGATAPCARVFGSKPPHLSAGKRNRSTLPRERSPRLLRSNVSPP